MQVAKYASCGPTQIGSPRIQLTLSQPIVNPSTRKDAHMANNASLFFTVAMLIVTAYFFLGSVPLLVLKHDNPVDASFIRSF